MGTGESGVWAGRVVMVVALALGVMAIVGSSAARLERTWQRDARTEAEQLEQQTRLHVSTAAMMSTLEAKLRTLAPAEGKIDLAALDRAQEEGVSADAYRNAAVATQQGLRVVIEKADAWPEAKLKLLLDGAKAKLAETEKLRQRVMTTLAKDVLGEHSEQTLGEIERGEWSGFAGEEGKK